MNVRVPETLLNLIKNTCVNPGKMKWGYTFGYFAADDLSEAEEDQMRKNAEYLNGKVAPISGYIQEIPNKGAYFIPIGDGMIMKIDCKLPQPEEVLGDDSPYTLKMEYRNKE